MKSLAHPICASASGRRADCGFCRQDREGPLCPKVAQVSFPLPALQQSVRFQVDPERGELGVARNPALKNSFTNIVCAAPLI
jgi:hypothetical protein